MSKRILIVMLTVFVLSTAAAHALDKRYTMKSAIVEYTMTGNQTGTETLYFEDYGKKEGRHTQSTTSFMGFKQSTESINIIDGEWAYNYDPKTNIATRMNWKEMSEQLAKNAASLRDYGQEMLESLGGTKAGTKEIAGKTCEVWDLPKIASQSCIYKGSLPLESRVSIAGMEIVTTATRIDENVAIPKDKLTLPKDAKIEDFVIPPEAAAAVQEMQANMQNGGFKNLMKNVSLAQEEAQEQNMSQKEMELKEKELELKQKELELREQEMAQELQKAPAKKSALDKTNDAVNTTNKVKQTFGGLRSILGR